MSRIKEMMGLVYWLDNTKQSNLEASLSNKRDLPRDRMQILKELEAERLKNPNFHGQSLGK